VQGAANEKLMLSRSCRGEVPSARSGLGYVSQASRPKFGFLT